MNLVNSLRLVACVVLLQVSGCASVKNDATVGSVLTPGNTQIPLPPGDWKVLATKNNVAGSSTNGGPNNQHSVQVTYALIEGGAIKALAIVSTSSGPPSTGGYTTGRFCLQTGNPEYVYFQDVRDRYIDNVDCVKVIGARRFDVPTTTSSDIYRDAYAQAQAFGGLSHTAIQVNFAQARSQRYTEYSIYFFPQRDGLSDNRADWRISTMSSANKKYADDIVAWAKSFRNAVRLGTDYAL